MRRHAPLIAAACCLGLTIPAAAQPETSRLESAEPMSTTPVLDEYRALWRGLTADYVVFASEISRTAAGLSVDDSTSVEKVRAGLERLQPSITKLLKLSHSAPENFDVLAHVGPGGNPRRVPWEWLHFQRFLEADASRCWDAGDWHGITERLTAQVRIGEHLAAPGSEIVRTGISFIRGAIRKLNPMLELGLRDHFSPEDRAALLAAFERHSKFAATDFAREWASLARIRAQEARQMYAVDGGPDRLADKILSVGVSKGVDATHARSRGDQLSLQMGDASHLIIDYEARVRKMTPREIDSEINAAEAMIPKIQTALASNDPSSTLPELGKSLGRLRSQVAKVIVQSPWVELHYRHLLHEESTRLLERLR